MASVDEFPVHYNSAVSGHELLSDLKAEQVEMEQTKVQINVGSSVFDLKN
jgi:hypothetical protein